MHHATGCCQHCWLPETPTPPAIGSGVVALPAPYPTSKRLARRLRTRGHGIPLDHPPAALGACCTTRHPLCGRCGTTGRSPPEAATLAAATEVVQSFHEPFFLEQTLRGRSGANIPALVHGTPRSARTDKPLPSRGDLGPPLLSAPGRGVVTRNLESAPGATMHYVISKARAKPARHRRVPQIASVQ